MIKPSFDSNEETGAESESSKSLSLEMPISTICVKKASFRNLKYKTTAFELMSVQ
jgi:hypothetical protein